jgi:hypothetical protein
MKTGGVMVMWQRNLRPSSFQLMGKLFTRDSHLEAPPSTFGFSLHDLTET